MHGYLPSTAPLALRGDIAFIMCHKNIAISREPEYLFAFSLFFFCHLRIRVTMVRLVLACSRMRCRPVGDPCC